MEPYCSSEEMKERVLRMIRQYNVMYPEQAVAFFPGKEKAAIKALKRLEKNRQIYKNPYTGLVSSSELAYSLKDDGTIKSLWVLLDMMKKRQIDGHYLVTKEDFPERILFHSGQEIYDILYVGFGDVKLVNGMFKKSRKAGENYIVATEDGKLISQIEVPGAIGYCVVKEGGVVEYYKKR